MRRLPDGMSVPLPVVKNPTFGLPVSHPSNKCLRTGSSHTSNACWKTFPTQKRPVVTFYDIEGEIYEKAKQQAIDLTADESSEEDDDQDEDRGPANKDLVFDLDDDINLDSPFLQGMLSDTRVSAPESTAATTGPVLIKPKDCEPTEDNWENCDGGVIPPFSNNF